MLDLDHAPEHTVTKAAADKAEKESKARSRQCFERELTHIRIGSWQATEGCTTTFVGTARQLHGLVCTCCSRRAA